MAEAKSQEEMVEEKVETAEKKSEKSADKDKMSKSEKKEEHKEEHNKDHKKEQKITIYKSELEKLEKEKEEYREHLQRLKAEFDNFRKRTVKEKEDFRKYALENFVLEILFILDNFERALQSAEKMKDFDSLREGISMIEKQFKEWLKTKNIKEIEALGTYFDPNFHQAVSQLESEEAEENKIISEMQKGYLINERVLRPSMVVVSKKAEPKQEVEENIDSEDNVSPSGKNN